MSKLTNTNTTNTNTNTTMSMSEEKRILDLETSLIGYRGIMSFMFFAVWLILAL